MTNLPKSAQVRPVLPSFESLSSDDERQLAYLQPAWAKAAHFFRTGTRFGHRTGSLRCMSLVELNRMLDVYHNRLKSGDTLSLLQAVAFCAEENLPLPTWLANAFCTRMSAFLKPGTAHSLDEVFYSRTLPTKSAKRGASTRQDWQLACKLCNDAWTLAKDDANLSPFDAVVERMLTKRKYGVRKTKAKQLIMMIERNQSQFLGNKISLSRFLEKRRKLQT